MKKRILLIFFIVPLIGLVPSCDSNSKQKKQQQEKIQDIRTKVDRQVDILKSSIPEFNFILSIDHSRLAREAGLYMPPSVVCLFSNPKVNSELIRINPLTGIDLPYKILCYSEPDTMNASIAFTSSAFILRRHGLKEDDLKAYKEDMEKVISSFPKSQIQTTNTEKIDRDYGITMFKSDVDFYTTLLRLKNAINAQKDTRWFGEVDFQKEAKEVNIEIRRTTLLLFGAPAQEGQAMFDSPRLGLDAFCQKVLVFENDKNQVIVAINDILAFADLYYDRSTTPQQIINQNLKIMIDQSLSNQAIVE